MLTALILDDELAGVPKSAYVGSLAGAPAAAAAALGAQSAARGGPFATLNGAIASDALCVVAPAGVALESPVHALYVSTAPAGAGASSSGNGSGGSAAGGALEAAAPRLLVVAGEGSAVEVVEEFVSASDAGSASLTCAVAEVALAQGAAVTHGYVQVRLHAASKKLRWNVGFRRGGAVAGRRYVHARFAARLLNGSSLCIAETVACTALALSVHGHLLLFAARGQRLHAYQGDAGAAGGRQKSHCTWQLLLFRVFNDQVDVRLSAPQREASGCTHVKATLVQQAAGSSYSLAETRTGGSLTRHDLGVHQAGPDTNTVMKHFLLAGVGQLQAR